MTITVYPLSTLEGSNFYSKLEDISYTQHKKNLEGNLSFNFVNCLSSVVDFKVKHYTNFYLTNLFKSSQIFDDNAPRIKSKKFTTKLKMGDEYWKFSDIDRSDYINVDNINESYNYGTITFQTDNPTIDNHFEISFQDDNVCNIHHYDDDVKYTLCSNDQNVLFFIKDNLLDYILSANTPQTFKYMYGDDNKFLYLYQKNTNGDYYVGKNNGRLALIPLSSDNISILANKIEIDRHLFYEIDLNHRTNFITYTIDNKIDLSESHSNLSNNYLIHYPTNSTEKYADVLILKNQHSHTGYLSQSNNLLSSFSGVNSTENRSYTSILDTIPQERSESLVLNYVFYNQDYSISPGSNTFQAPSSMVPFESLNINDTKFVESGSFSFTSPKYADKVYRIDSEQVSNDKQHLLCTWLSGSPASKNKVWIDRYYYPDLISKENAILANPHYAKTYDEYIEDMIQNNTSLRENVSKIKFFDKKSDMVFVPNARYRYERISTDLSTSIIPRIDTFNEINIAGKLTLSFYFNDDSRNWTLKSNSNSINNGLVIKKTESDITITYNLYDPSTGLTTIFDITSPIKKLEKNFVLVTIDSLTGFYKVFLNGEQLQSSSFKVAQFYRKRLLNGDFLVNGDTQPDEFELFEKVRILNSVDDIEMVYLYPILDGEQRIETINITLPCGLKNSFDDIDNIHSICSNESFKSNEINVIIKNLNISNSNILENLKNEIEKNIQNCVPVGCKINNIEFDNYKS